MAKSSKRRFAIGIDYGTDSCRALLVDTATGKELGEEVFNFPRWSKGMYCDPGQTSSGSIRRSIWMRWSPW